MNYSHYLFQQLFHAYLLEECVEVPYDLLLPIIEMEYDKFLESEFNTEYEGEYDCIADYLLANLDTISITIADHSNI